MKNPDFKSFAFCLIKKGILTFLTDSKDEVSSQRGDINYFGDETASIAEMIPAKINTAEGRKELIEKVEEIKGRLPSYIGKYNEIYECLDRLNDILGFYSYAYSSNTPNETAFKVRVANVKEKLYNMIENDECDASETLCLLPLRMTREKYNELVYASLTKMYTDIPLEEAASYMEGALKPSFYSVPGGNVRALFPKLDEYTVRFNSLKEKNYPIDEITRLKNEVNSDVIDTERDMDVLYISREILFALASSLNALNELDEEDIKECTAFLDEVGSKDKEKALTKYEALIFSKRKEISEWLSDADPVDFILQENENDKYHNLFNRLYEEEYAYLQNNVPCIEPPADLDGLIKEFIQYMEESVAHLPNILKKFIKQRFLYSLPIDMSHKELQDYISYSLDGISDFKKGEYYISKLEDFIHENI